VLDSLLRLTQVQRLVAELESGRRCVAIGAAGSSTSFLAGAIARSLQRPVVLVVAHLDDADEAVDELIEAGIGATRLATMQSLPGETGPAIELLAERLALVREVLGAGESLGSQSRVIVCSIQALMQSVPIPSQIAALTRRVARGERVDPRQLAMWLESAGYSRVDAVEEPGDYAMRGGILDIFPPALVNASGMGSQGSGGRGDGGGGGSREGPSVGSGGAVRLDFFGDEIEKITEIDLDTMGSDRVIDSVELVCASLEVVRSDDRSMSFLELLPSRCVAIIAETLEVVEQGRGYFERLSDSKGIYGPPAVLGMLEKRFGALAEVNQFSAGAVGAEARIELPIRPLPTLAKEVSEGIAELVQMGREGVRVVVHCQNEGERARCGELLEEHAAREGSNDAAREERVGAHVGYLHRGLVIDDERVRASFVPYHELMHRFGVRRRTGVRLRAARAMDTFLDFAPGDFVVHAEHGIARYAGLKLMKPRALPGRDPFQSSEQEEYLTLEFAGSAKLHVPAMQIDLVQRYVGGFGGKPKLSTLGGTRWKQQKERVSESVRDLASELLRVRAAREHMPGIAYPADTPWQREFEDEFPYDETEDQLASLAAIKRDMQSERPMDRLVCGDVGFGKTELAIRAAFKACEFGKQAALLVPTTVLAEQHERTFKGRFAGYPFRVESLSRFKSDAEQKLTLEMLRKGQVDVIIGTHRLLSKDVAFADLGIVIVDEEQRFGVEHKESLLRMRLTADVLSLSATPIPRTLHMSMLGIRDISSLTTPPADRRAIVTEVIPYNERRITQAIARELGREGQVYIVNNRVHNIHRVAADIRRLVPEARIVVGHGQMPPHELEEVMLRFMRREADILLSTTIIESGIDIPTANTMIILDADRFGLADLHQLRGRVGRYKHRAYCYLLLPEDRPVKEKAQKRLKAIEQYSMLGAGFKIAMRDLEIRGAGNLLGPEQSGHIAAVGYDTYCRLLDQSVKRLNNEVVPEPVSATTIEIGIPGVIPKPYIPADQRRLEAYRRIASAQSQEELAKVRADMVDAYGEPPRAVERLLDLASLRLALAGLGVRAISIRERDVVFRTPTPHALASALQSAGRGVKGTVTPLAPKSTDSLAEVYYRPPEQYMEPETLLTVLRHRLVGPRVGEGESTERPAPTSEASSSTPRARNQSVGPTSGDSDGAPTDAPRGASTSAAPARRPASTSGPKPAGAERLEGFGEVAKSVPVKPGVAKRIPVKRGGLDGGVGGASGAPGKGPINPWKGPRPKPPREK
jgi:transcription-repair coupling factor (superfamily II helicase)